MSEPQADGREPEGEKKKKPRGMPAIFIFFLILIGIVLLLEAFNSSAEEKLGYNEFHQKLYRSEVAELRVKGSGTSAKAYLRLFGDEEKVYEVDLPPTDLERSRLDEIKSFVGWEKSELSESALLMRLDDEESSFWPNKAWTVGSGAGDDEREALFVDYWADRHTRTRAEITAETADRVNLPQLCRALEDRGVEVEQKLIAGAGGPGTLEKKRKSFVFEPENTLLWGLFLNIVPWILIIAIFWFLIFRQMRSPGGAGGVLSFGRAKPAMVAKDRTGVSFEDVAGVEEAKDEVREIVEFLRDPTRFSRVGARIPRGILLVGRPGTGKTLLARAIAGEANVPFFSISGSDFVEMFVGVGASRVRDLFRQAREKSPCLIFLDEIDAVGRRRGSGLGGGHDEREQTLNAILVEMDGFETDEGIILIAATNRPDVLDPALLRPGRFDRQVTIDLPDVKGREAILQVHTRNVRIDPGVDLMRVARGTPGFSGAELASLVNEAALQAVLDGRERVSLLDLEEARDRVRFGREKSARVMEEKDKLITAYHEAGHALVGALHPGVEPLHKVTIIPRGMALGATMVLPEKDRYHQRREELVGNITFAFGGRIAEEMFCGDVTSGAYDDIRRATQMARMMVCQFGMSEKLGPVNYEERDDSIFLGNEVVKHRNYSEETARIIDAEVKQILDECYAAAEEILQQNKEKVESITRALMTYEIVHGEEVQDILAGDSPEQAHAKWTRRHAGAPPPLPRSAPDKSSRTEPDEGLGPAGEPVVP